MTCAVLHNVAKDLNDGFDYIPILDNDEGDVLEEIHGGRPENRATKFLGEQKRQIMLEFI